MTITSRYAGRCRACGGGFNAGDRIRWGRESGPRHLTDAMCEAARAAAVQAPAPAAAAPAPAFDGAPIAAFLQAAQARGLRFPKVRFLGPDGRAELLLKLAGARSRFPGSVSVSLGGEWIGSITTDGRVMGRLAARADVLATLGTIATNPAEAARAYGAITSNCSFCGRSLTDEGSVDVGYGPICAQKYNLPHRARGSRTLTPVAEVAPAAPPAPPAPPAPAACGCGCGSLVDPAAPHEKRHAYDAYGRLTGTDFFVLGHLTALLLAEEEAAACR